MRNSEQDSRNHQPGPYYNGPPRDFRDIKHDHQQPRGHRPAPPPGVRPGGVMYSSKGRWSGPEAAGPPSGRPDGALPSRMPNPVLGRNSQPPDWQHGGPAARHGGPPGHPADRPHSVHTGHSSGYSNEHRSFKRQAPRQENRH